jgi:chorismate mutase
MMSDLICLILCKALSRRIHYGKFVAEVKFRDAPQDYEPAIRAQVNLVSHCGFCFTVVLK